MKASPKRRKSPAPHRRLLHSLAPEETYHRLFDLIPGVAFFAKDRRSRLIAANRHFYERLGLRSERALIGRDDFALFPARLAEHFQKDDAEVIRTGRAKLNIVELFFNPQGIPDWFITHKLPMRDRRGRVVGVLGITQSYGFGDRHDEPRLAIDKAVAIVRRRFRERLTVGELAAAVHLSPRQLHRKFVEVFGSSPQLFLLKVRIQAACELLQEGDRLISDIAHECGFPDQSSFTQHFRKHLGMTPRRYRQRQRLTRRERRP